MLKNIDIQNLQSGMVIVKVTKQNGPIKIKKSGLVTSQDMVQGLIEMGVQQVAIDPDQTVEVEAPTIKKSATRRMLESNNATQARTDDGGSEQFHRSLFLPSVQSIPSAWQFYAKRYGVAAFITLGGLGFGWTLANYQSVALIFSPEPAKTVVNIESPVTESEQLNTPIKEVISEATSTNKQPDVTASTTQQSATIPPETTQGAVVPDNTPTTTSTSEPQSQISADVLARFRKAVTEIEGAPTPQVPVDDPPNNDNVPRIDQLPAWVMTRLPSMAFSAHMYASEESERWVRVNGTRMVEGDKIDGEIEIVRIEPQRVILNYSGQTFAMAALTDW
ncbi:general secretion pathway protein GspB [uncultured Paraglaciecola sp.]|uniref:general secretion pathway protein GspB n=1 Tax=uncultured Paraglaciecola sp. TaxID=1765024 RepID=UPI00260FEDF9|nr:general secretion pathway protein GspB [uncultured Paraglaciecola sp.]